jgi:hypothetical protein
MVKPVHCSTSSDIEATVALIIESDGPGIARDIFVIFDILHPGGPSMLELRAPNTAAFDIFPLMGFHTAFVAKDSFKLPPGGRIQVCSLYLRFIPPFEQRLYLHMNYGCAGAPTRQHSLRHTPDTLEEICRSTAALPENKQTDSFMSKVFGEPGLLPERVPTLKER